MPVPGILRTIFLLHKLQQTDELKAGDEVKVYLYKDPHGRMTASPEAAENARGPDRLR